MYSNILTQLVILYLFPYNMNTLYNKVLNFVQVTMHNYSINSTVLMAKIACSKNIVLQKFVHTPVHLYCTYIHRAVYDIFV